jgi:cell division protein FtsB
VSVKTCNDQISQENDHLKREVKKLELEVNKLNNQAKVQHAQDNRSNIVKKVEKGKITSKITSQASKKQVQNEKDEKYNM